MGGKEQINVADKKVGIFEIAQKNQVSADAGNEQKVPGGIHAAAEL